MTAYESPGQRAHRLLASMTLDEKIGQTVYVDTRFSNREDDIRAGKVGVIACEPDAGIINRLQRIALEETRLGIPIMFGHDVIHGYRTIFPIPVAEACGWDMDLMEKTAAIAAEEASANGTHWIYAPMIDIARDPRWGRIAEGAGEDVYFGCRAARARTAGFKRHATETGPGTLACAKHYVAYGAAEGGRDYDGANIPDNMLRDIYLPPFKAAVEAGAESVMTSFNDYNGLPVTANKYLIKRVLREELGFKGIVVTDYNAIRELIAHGVAANPAEACLKAVDAGIDMDMNGDIYMRELPGLVRQGIVDESVIDEIVLRVLSLKYRLGLFDCPYASGTAAALNADYRKTARLAAQKSIVLLENRNEALPLKEGVKSIAIVGPLADNPADMLGCWSCGGDPSDVATLYQAIRNRGSGSIRIKYVKGCGISDDAGDDIEKAVNAALDCDICIAAVGESADLSGEFHSRSSLGLPGMQERLVRAVVETGKPVVAVLFAGRPLALPWLYGNAAAVLKAWHPGVEGGNALADVIFGDYNPSGRLVATIPQSAGQTPIYYSRKKSGKPPFEGSFEQKVPVTNYIDIGHKPQYPFGYGLSYSKIAYKKLTLGGDCLKIGETLYISVDVENAGLRDAEETVQVYIQDVTASLTRPVKELKAFAKAALRSGEVKTVSLEVDTSGLGFHIHEGRYIVEPGTFRLWAGPNSDEGLESSFELI